MKNITKTQLIFGGVVLGLGVMIFLYVKNKPLPNQLNNVDKNGVEPNQNNEETQQNKDNENNSSLDSNLILKLGSKGAEVMELQKRLINDYGQDLGKFGDNQDGVDGIFGSVTLAGLLKAKQVSEIALKDL